MCAFLAKHCRYHLIFIRILWRIRKSTPNLAKMKIGLVFLGYMAEKRQFFEKIDVFFSRSIKIHVRAG